MKIVQRHDAVFVLSLHLVMAGSRHGGDTQGGQTEKRSGPEKIFVHKLLIKTSLIPAASTKDDSGRFPGRLVSISELGRSPDLAPAKTPSHAQQRTVAHIVLPFLSHRCRWHHGSISLTVAGTAPDSHRIPFFLPSLGEMNTKFAANL